MNERQATVLIFIGVNGTGKTTQMVRFLKLNGRNLVLPSNIHDKAWRRLPMLEYEWGERYNPEKDKNYRAVKIPNLNTFSGHFKMDVGLHDKQVLRAILDPRDGLVNAGLFLDDFKSVIPSQGLLPAITKKLFIDRRHRMLDLFLASHSLSDINGEIIQYGPRFVIFKTTRGLNDTVEKKMPGESFQRLQECIARVNQRARTNPYYNEVFDTQ